MKMRAELDLGSTSRRGHRHTVEGVENQDVVLVRDDHARFHGILIVADGMGGHPLPLEAARAGAAAAMSVLDQEQGEPAQELVERAIAAGHEAVRRLSRGETRPPGTTLSLALFEGTALHTGHVGDGSLLLVREGRMNRISGGEHQRTGSRPNDFLGSPAEPVPEMQSLKLQEGDRLLLCTDGLTRCLRDDAALRDALVREDVASQALADQLAAAGRPRDYDDDTSLALARVTALRPAPPKRRAAAPTASRPEPRRAGSSILAPLLLTALLAAGGGFAAGRWLLPPATSNAPGETPANGGGEEPPAASRRSLPREPLVLIDPLGRSLYSLAGGSSGPPARSVTLDAFRLGPDGRLAAAGRYHLDLSKHLLTGPGDEAYAVETTPGSTALRPYEGVVIRIPRRGRGEVVEWQGKLFGPTPVTLVAPPGSYDYTIKSGDRTISRGTIAAEEPGQVIEAPR